MSGNLTLTWRRINHRNQMNLTKQYYDIKLYRLKLLITRSRCQMIAMTSLKTILLTLLHLMLKWASHQSIKFQMNHLTKSLMVQAIQMKSACISSQHTKLMRIPSSTERIVLLHLGQECVDQGMSNKMALKILN